MGDFTDRHRFPAPLPGAATDLCFADSGGMERVWPSFAVPGWITYSLLLIPRAGCATRFSPRCTSISPTPLSLNIWSSSLNFFFRHLRISIKLLRMWASILRIRAPSQARCLRCGFRRSPVNISAGLNCDHHSGPKLRRVLSCHSAAARGFPGPDRARWSVQSASQALDFQHVPGAVDPPGRPSPRRWTASMAANCASIRPCACFANTLRFGRSQKEHAGHVAHVTILARAHIY